MKNTVLELHAEHVRARPDAVALSGVAESISYGELDRRSNRLARLLGSLGVGSGALVAVSLHRSPTTVVAILGVLKSGAAYLPIDPVNPRNRVRLILEDARPAAVLTESGLASTFEGLDNVIEIDRDPGAAEAHPIAAAVEISPSDLAYVIYTSGTTGRPKGVMITHHNLHSLMTASHPLFGFDETDVWTMFHSYGFDVSVWEMWGALAYGGRLIVPSADTARSPDAFYDIVAREGVTVLCQTPSAFNSILALEDQGKASSLALRHVIFAGERLDPARLRSWFERHGDETPRMVNMYGITETTIHSTFRRILKADCDGIQSPIGTALPHLEIRLLSESGQAVPDGAVGEIYVLGDGVAKGYLNRADLTDERFVSSPDGRRMYRSGDLAHRSPNGDLIYHGRVDTQVQIRGFRVELGEIESAIRQSEVVDDVVVTYVEDRWGGALTAYVVTPDRKLSPDAEKRLRSDLATKLPGYMVPAGFVAIEALPLTANGKVDRSALPLSPAHGVSERVGDAAFMVAGEMSGTMQRLAAIWTEFLKVDGVEENTDFFEAGGHSLLAVEVMIRVREEFGIEIPLGSMYEHTTLTELADRIDQFTKGTEEFLV